MDHNTPRASGSKRRKKEQPGIDESLCAYDDFATYDAMAMDEFKNMVQSPSLGQSRVCFLLYKCCRNNLIDCVWLAA